MKRLSKSAALRKWNAMTIRIKQLEVEMASSKDEKAVEVGGGGLMHDGLMSDCELL